RHRLGGRFSEFTRPCATPVMRAPTAPGLKSTARTSGSGGKRRRRSPPGTVSGRLMGIGEEGLESLVLGQYRPARRDQEGVLVTATRPRGPRYSGAGVSKRGDAGDAFIRLTIFPARPAGPSPRRDRPCRSLR